VVFFGEGVRVSGIPDIQLHGNTFIEFIYILPETNEISPEKRPYPKRKESFSKHHFLEANWSVYIIYILCLEK